MAWFEDQGEAIILTIRAAPRSSQDCIVGLYGNALKVRIQAPPVEGKANAYLIKYLSKEWKVPRAAFDILSGETGRNKRVRITNPPKELRAMLLTIKPG